MPKKHFSINFPTKPWLGKYLHSLYGNPLVFSSDDYFGMLLAAGLEKKVYRDRSEEEVRQRFDKFTTTIEIFFPSHWLRNYYHGTDFSREKVIFINKIMENRFEEDLYRWCDWQTKSDVQRKIALELFCAEHRIIIDDEITYDCLKQMEYRFRINSKKKKINPLDLSPRISGLQTAFF